MAIAFRSKNSASGVTNSLTITKPAGTVSGDVLVAFIARELWSGGANTVATPSGWVGFNDSTYNADPGFGGGPGEGIAGFYKVAGGSEPASYTFSLVESRSCVGVICAYSGASIYNPYETSGFGFSNNPEPITVSSSSNPTTQFANDMYVCCGAADLANGTVTTPAGTTSRHNEVGPSSGSWRTVMQVSDQFVAGAGTTLSKSFVADDTTVGGNFRVGVLNEILLKPNVAPNTPTVLQVNTATSDTTPNFSARISDIDTRFGGAQPIKARFEVYENDGVTLVGTVDSITYTTYDAGQQYRTANADYPTPLIPRTYKVRVQTVDDEPLTSAFTSLVSFDICCSGTVSITDSLGDLSATATATTTGSVTLTGFGDLSAFATTPLCQFAYIAYDYAGAFFCLDNLGNFVTPIGSNVRDICIVDC
jgi:hypothetical protein